LDSRLLSVARSYDCEDLPQFISKVRSGATDDIKRDIVEAMTTNESLFFRDKKPFDYIKEKLVEQYIEQNAVKHFKFWSAASSTGQEAYSLAMMMHEIKSKNPAINVNIHATDIDNKVVEQAKAGKFSQLEVQRGLPVKLLMQHFNQEDKNTWAISPEIKQYVKFETHNLVDSAAKFGKFDVIFCRYVLIYFDDATRVSVVKNLQDCLNPNGYIVLGSSEFLPDACSSFESVADCRGLYQCKV